MVVGERLNERIKAAGLSQSEVARRVGVAQATVNALVKGTSRQSVHLHRIAQVLETSTAYLEGETDDPTAGAVPLPAAGDIADQLDLVPIGEIDLAYGLGGTYADGPIEKIVRHFPRSFVEAITSAPPIALTLARGRGDSMEPTIRDNELVIIDTSERQVRYDDLIWALTVGEIGMIKRLRIRGRRVTIMSDNKDVRPDQVDADEINIVGRVIFVGRRL